VNRVVAGVNCFHIKDLNDVIRRSNISIAIIAAPPDSAATVAELLVNAGIKGILNFTTVPVNVPETIYLEEYDMITSMEKVAYFVKPN
ncbi:MAG TPA: redox-sensing transcriptional repressor Rex, partial [Tenuifilaceae bacterium]|nr:redox-sensing transcriptional repressor Rex [Tenuifilaceae bacterium]